jgi:hypothetical protein
MNFIVTRPILLKYHRNGVSGIGFYSLNFEWRNIQSGESGKDFLATFETDETDENVKVESCRVINIKNIMSCWRGDNFGKAIQKKFTELGHKYSKPMIYDLIQVINEVLEDDSAW